MYTGDIGSGPWRPTVAKKGLAPSSTGRSSSFDQNAASWAASEQSNTMWAVLRRVLMVVSFEVRVVPGQLRR
jgi:hypothetical protein